MSRINAIDRLTLRAYPDKYAPPSEPMLELAMVDDVLFIKIVKHDESASESKDTEVAHIEVDAEAALDAVFILVRDVLRSQKKESV